MHNATLTNISPDENLFFLNLVTTGGSAFIIDEISANKIKKQHLHDTRILPETEKFVVNAKHIAEQWLLELADTIASNTKPGGGTSWSILVSYLSRYYFKSHGK